MKALLQFNRNYFAITILLFVVEVLIALFLHDKFIRPYFGDFLVVILIYCFLKSFLNIAVNVAAVSVLAFAFFVEITQYFNAIGRFGLAASDMAKAVLGNSFAWMDLLMYVGGIFCVVLVEKLRSKK